MSQCDELEDDHHATGTRARHRSGWMKLGFCKGGHRLTARSRNILNSVWSVISRSFRESHELPRRMTPLLSFPWSKAFWSLKYRISPAHMTKYRRWRQSSAKKVSGRLRVHRPWVKSKVGCFHLPREGLYDYPRILLAKLRKVAPHTQTSATCCRSWVNNLLAAGA